MSCEVLRCVSEPSLQNQHQMWDEVRGIQSPSSFDLGHERLPQDFDSPSLNLCASRKSLQSTDTRVATEKSGKPWSYIALYVIFLMWKWLLYKQGENGLVNKWCWHEWWPYDGSSFLSHRWVKHLDTIEEKHRKSMDRYILYSRISKAIEAIDSKRKCVLTFSKIKTFGKQTLNVCTIMSWMNLEVVNLMFVFLPL